MVRTTDQTRRRLKRKPEVTREESRQIFRTLSIRDTSQRAASRTGLSNAFKECLFAGQIAGNKSCVRVLCKLPAIAYL